MSSNRFQPPAGLTPEQFQKLLSGQEPSGLPTYLMQARKDVAYHVGTGIIDLGQFPRGFGRQLVLERDIPDFHVYLTLADYLIPANFEAFGWSPNSSQLAG